MKKISNFGSFLIGALLTLFLVMPQLQGSQNSANNAESEADTVELADTKGKVIAIGLMQQMDHPSLDMIREGIYEGLEARGYVDGENIAIDYQNGQGDQNNFKMIADNFVAGEKDMVVGIATAAVQALANSAQGELPVIMSAVSDPVAAGLLDDLDNPGGNVTGVSDYTPIEEQLDLMVKVLPEMKTMGIIYNSSEVNVKNHVEEAKTYAESLGLEVEEATITSTNDLAQVAEQLAGKVDAIWVPNDNTIASSMPTLIQVTDSQKVPVFPVVDAMVADGGLATVGLNQRQIGVDTANVIADIIEGEDTATYPVHFTSKVDVYYNSDTAERLGITLPAEITAGATDVNPEKEKADETTPKPAVLGNGEKVEIGLLQQMEHPSLDLIRQGIVDGLEKRGYVEGENIAIDYQNGQGDQNNLKMIADDYVAQDKDMLVAIATLAAQALANAAQGNIPVIAGAVSDPVGAGLIDSNEKPGGNITGTSDITPVAEQLDLVMEVLPEAKTIGILYNSSEVNVQRHVATAKDYAANDLGLKVEEGTITSTNDLAQVAEELAGKVDAIWVPNDNTIASAMPTLIQATNSHDVPVFPVVDKMVEQGGLATLGISQYQFGLDTATVIADVIEGADTATYPTLYTTKADLYYNSATAKKLGITLPERIIKEGTDVAKEGGE